MTTFIGADERAPKELFEDIEVWVRVSREWPRWKRGIARCRSI